MKNNRKHLPKIIAHRGASALAEHENTLESFEIAIDLDCDMAEFDIRKTGDGRLIVFHDTFIYKEEHMRFVPKPVTTFTKSKRYYAAKKSPYKGKRISKLTYERINRIAGGQGYRVPSLDEVLTLCKGKIFLDVEIKESGFEDEVVDAIVNEYGYSYDEFSIKSFKPEVSKRIKEIDPNHLLSTGNEGLMGCENDLSLVERVNSIPGVDYMTIHIWPYNWGWARAEALEEDLDNARDKTTAYIGLHSALARKYGLPLVAEEFGFPRDGFATAMDAPTTCRDAYYSHVFSFVGDQLQGANFWGWSGFAVSASAQWERGDDYTGDPAQEAQGLNGVYIGDSTVEVVKTAINNLNIH